MLLSSDQHHQTGMVSTSLYRLKLMRDFLWEVSKKLKTRSLKKFSAQPPSFLISVVVQGRSDTVTDLPTPEATTRSQ